MSNVVFLDDGDEKDNDVSILDDGDIIPIKRSRGHPKKIKNIQSVKRDIDSLVDWAREWRMAFNYEKCITMFISNREFSSNPINLVMTKDDDSAHNFTRTKSARDLGFILSDDLKWNNHVSLAVSKANSVLGILKRTFKFWNIETFKILFTTYVRPHLDYAAPVWNPYKKKLKCSF
ncbi:unnamed protein product [Brachionus calyciflorus]|uniref:RNA-directed DNA polymerase from mobile element jockey-like n=1 Tax=Brachionus calyciflorus TaxID=104777 RepID=A0A813TIB0_9BILA|nr:unnamed protein product [Brachionus calyciflorus]